MADTSNPSHNGPSPVSFWLEEALTSWILPAVAVAIVVGTAGLYLAGIAPEAVTGAVVTVAASLAAAVFILRPALDPGREARGRALLWAAAALTLLFTAAPSLQAILPGNPLFEGDVGIPGESVLVPQGASGLIRVLVNGKLKEGGEPSVSFRFTGTEQPIEGKLERTIGYARVGRGGRTRVAHDHTSDWYEAKLPPGATELRLAELRGQPAGRLQVSIYRDWLPHPLILAAALSALLLAAAADARLGMKGNAAVASGMSLAFGLLVSFNATPGSAVGPAVGGVVLGAMVGALAGALAGWLGRKVVPAAKRRSLGKPGRKNGAAVA
jgi:hypothetical protein